MRLLLLAALVVAGCSVPQATAVETDATLGWYYGQRMSALVWPTAKVNLWGSPRMIKQRGNRYCVSRASVVWLGTRQGDRVSGTVATWFPMEDSTEVLGGVFVGEIRTDGHFDGAANAILRCPCGTDTVSIFFDLTHE